jgi:threonine dehydrogenase-like Zn-dependent dehydrogenase
LVDHAVSADASTSDHLADLTDGAGFSAAVDCSGSAPGRQVAVAGTATWGRCAFVGEGGQVTLDVSQQLIHKQVAVYGSWVTSIGHMGDLLGHLDRWRLHPEVIVTDRFGLDQAEQAYQVADGGTAGKVCIILA